MTLNERIAEIDLSDFKIKEVTKTDKFTLIKAVKEYPVYFAFFANFIVCAGDYGEWTFDCTWETNKNQIPQSLNYLVEKLSRDCKKMIRSGNDVENNFREAKKHLYDNHDINRKYCDDEVLTEVDSIFEDFLYDLLESDEYRCVPIVDDYADQICDKLNIAFDVEEWVDFFEAGEVLNPQLVVNLAMLQKLREINILFDDHYGT